MKRTNQHQQPAKRHKGTAQDSPAASEPHGGLNVAIHPLLRGIAAPTLPKNHNPLKQNVRKGFDPLAINPYLTQSGPKSLRSRQLQFNAHGKYITEAEELRRKLDQEAQAKKDHEEKLKQGLAPDETVGEHLWRHEVPPRIEWWDKPYLMDRDYIHIDDETRLVLDSEDAPVSLYIQHPVLADATYSQHKMPEKALYLTKKEMKRIRKNDRQEKLKDKQDRIKLGLDAPPPPKVKLSNLMNVLTNEAIKDPTAVEKRVRQEVEDRLQKHLQTNEERKLTKDEKHQKIHEQHQKDLQKGFFTTVFKIDKLVNPSHFFKVDINAKQLELLGICLLNPKFNLVIVEGGLKSIKFYKKLLTRRIDWTVNAPPKDDPDAELEDLSTNRCEIVWEGQVKDLKFKKWSIMRSQNEEEAADVLGRFGIENYWREANALGKE
ncbi:Pre-mRNA-splicing factor 3 [Suhomyces tanzawaensis NRRL Y-17324]|uniref:Pre-mRNA-splicing factor 3 n=1 Tax=Suhomyces tanzawaensis NRRL Y-17324 TaxID=984487 RepID=A0A1E4SHD8_9ASCO|nr:Pre-mRNA-splicing factor 3 [Suhomyces tanzawaensis NRRL Y-17324]ODV78924.1 Pre-mRNA-splicing factor 3 [Suhomyces tanzawaensis NRRL Y-17324]